MYPLALRGLALCKTAFSSWRAFVAEQKRYKERIEDAEKWHKDMIIKDGICKWFEVNGFLESS